MQPEIAVVGELSSNRELQGKLAQLRYEMVLYSEAELFERLDHASPPKTIIVYAEGCNVDSLLPRLRRSRVGAVIPMLLIGRVGIDIGDLADVIELGADHFLSAASSVEDFANTLLELAGPPSAREGESSSSEDYFDDGIDWATSLGGSPEVDPTPEFFDSSSMTSTMIDYDEAVEGIQPLAQTGTYTASSEISKGESFDKGVSSESAPREFGDATELLNEAHEFAKDSSAGQVVEGESDPQPLPFRRGIPMPKLRALPFEDQDSSSVEVSANGEMDSSLSDGMGQTSVIQRGDRDHLLSTLHRLGAQAQGGELMCSRRGEEFQLWLRSGCLVDARASNLAPYLAERLQAQGLLTSSQAEVVQGWAEEKLRAAFHRMIACGFVKERELERLARREIRGIVESLATWNEGEVFFDSDSNGVSAVTETHQAGRTSYRGDARDKNRLDHLLEDAIADLMGVEGLIEELGGARQSFKWVDEKSVNRGQDDWRGKCDGQFSLEQIVKLSEQPEKVLAAIYFALLGGELESAGERVSVHDPVRIDRERIQERLWLAREADYFRLLGLKPGARGSVVLRAYAEISESFSDEHLEEQTRDEMGRELIELRTILAEAREVLSNDLMRAAYLAHLSDEDLAP